MSYRLKAFITVENDSGVVYSEEISSNLGNVSHLEDRLKLNLSHSKARAITKKLCSTIYDENTRSERSS